MTWQSARPITHKLSGKEQPLTDAVKIPRPELPDLSTAVCDGEAQGGIRRGGVENGTFPKRKR